MARACATRVVRKWRAVISAPEFTPSQDVIPA
jgi:hypothetical protein